MPFRLVMSMDRLIHFSLFFSFDMETGENTIWLDCGYARLGDAKASRLLKWFINNPSSNISALTDLYFAHNQLTKIPDEIAQLDTLRTAFFHGNDIESIQAGAFPFSSALKESTFLHINSL